MKIIFAIGVVAGGIFQLVYYVFTKNKFDQLPVALGVILKSTLDDYSDTGGRRVFKANIKYKFKVGGSEFESSNIALRAPQIIPNFNYEYELVETYKEGDEIQVRYMLGDPKNSFIVVAPLSMLSVMAIIVSSILAVTYLLFMRGYIKA